ncbi:hypothetical protein GCM10023196_094880 [Actinoallomurus vinaceus]|uniref:Uncharacterized protein n=1 Tax=Actinoallomurus vinaceus TaxID=1080074 RepID=A0ABP8UTH4_9ACTN
MEPVDRHGPALTAPDRAPAVLPADGVRLPGAGPVTPPDPRLPHPHRIHAVRIDGTYGQVIIDYRPEPGGPAAAALAPLAEL